MAKKIKVTLLSAAPAPASFKTKYKGLFMGDEEIFLFRFEDGAKLWICGFYKNIVYLPNKGDTMEQAEAIYERLGNSYFERELNARRIFWNAKGERDDKFDKLTGDLFIYIADEEYPKTPADLFPIEFELWLKEEDKPNDKIISLTPKQWEKITATLSRPAVFYSEYEVIKTPYKFGLCKYGEDGNLVELPADKWDEAQFLYVEQTRKLYVHKYTRDTLRGICRDATQRFNYDSYNYQYLTTENGETVIKCGYYFTPKK